LLQHPLEQHERFALARIALVLGEAANHFTDVRHAESIAQRLQLGLLLSPTRRQLRQSLVGP
jgi:hypothetical protein